MPACLACAAVPLWMVSQKHMAKLLKHYRGRFSNGAPREGWCCSDVHMGFNKLCATCRLRGLLCS